VSIRKGHTYRIVVSDLIRERPIWFGGIDRSEASMDAFYKWLGPKKSKGIKIAVMDMWKPFMKSTKKKGHAPQTAVLFDKFHSRSSPQSSSGTGAGSRRTARPRRSSPSGSSRESTPRSGSSNGGRTDSGTKSTFD